MSGFIPTVEGFELDLERPLPPIAIGHGTYDPVIPVEFGRSARGVLEGAGAELCLVAARRVDPADTRLHATGPDAQAVLDLVRTYA